MNLLCTRLILTVFLILVFFQLVGCGETLQGVRKDARRMGKGVKTIFVRDGE